MGQEKHTPLTPVPFTIEDFAQAYIKFRQEIRKAEEAALLEKSTLEQINDLFMTWLSDRREQEYSSRDLTLLAHQNEKEAKAAEKAGNDRERGEWWRGQEE